MQEKYGPVCEQLDVLLADSKNPEYSTAESRQTLDNVTAIFDELDTRLLTGIAENKRLKANEEKPAERMGSLSLDSDQEEEKQDVKKQGGGLGFIEEEKEEVKNGQIPSSLQADQIMMMDMMERMPPPETCLQCVKCKKQFKDEEQDKIIFVDECLHVACKDCLKPAISESYPEVFCLEKGCEAKLSDYEIR